MTTRAAGHSRRGGHVPSGVNRRPKSQPERRFKGRLIKGWKNPAGMSGLQVRESPVLGLVFVLAPGLIESAHKLAHAPVILDLDLRLSFGQGRSSDSVSVSAA